MICNICNDLDNKEYLSNIEDKNPIVSIFLKLIIDYFEYID
jgi:hypothetical protein